jgi:hypothetical protein
MGRSLEHLPKTTSPAARVMTLALILYQASIGRPTDFYNGDSSIASLCHDIAINSELMLHFEKKTTTEFSLAIEQALSWNPTSANKRLPKRKKQHISSL